ncbi:MAG: restriction endonuclease subunit S [Kiritimatiellia bacterium]|jgi:type I restriction enzyme S subunit|nr:restriction endonuclease subunit S [Kiritimatiellia bacterium]
MNPASKKPALTPKLRFPEFRGAKGWSAVPGDKLFDQISNRDAPAGLPILAITQEHGAIPREDIDYHVSVTDKSVETYKEVLPGDFIISLRSFQGGIEYSEYHGICSPAYVILRKRTELVDLFYRIFFKSHQFIQQLTKNLEGLRDGKMISYNQFSELLLPEPTRPEQHKIATCLSSLDDLIGAEGRKLDALKAHKKGLMQQLFPREDESVPRLRFPEFRDAGEWNKTPTREIADVLQGYGFPERFQGKREGQYPVYKVRDISRTHDAGSRYIDEAAHYIDHQTLKVLRAKTLPAGTTIFAKIGEALRLNKRVITTKPCVVDNNVAGVKAIKGKATDLFLYYLWSTISLADYSGGVVPAVNKSKIEALLVTHPPMDEQDRIATGLSLLDDLIAAQSYKLFELKIHKQWLMQQLFPSIEEAHV